MAAYPTKLAATTRYFDPELTKCYFLPTIAASTLIPSRAEMTAGTDLSGEIADLAGWTVTSDQIETPDMGSRFTSKIGGRTSAADSSLTFYASQDALDVRTVLPRGSSGFIVWCDGGDNSTTITAQKADVFPVTVISNSQERSIAKDAARRMVQFSITRRPAESVSLPTNP